MLALAFAPRVAPRGAAGRRTAVVVRAAVPLHVEYCQAWNYLPRATQLRAAIEKKHGDKYSVVLNDPALLKSLSPSGNWRRGAFEVVRTDTNEVLYSKLQTGSHLVDGISDKLDKFVAGL